MRNLVAAELRKARSIRTTWLLAAAAVGFCALWTVVSVLTLDDPSQAGLALEQRVQNVYQMAQQAYLFALILGIVGMAGEHRHQTLTLTLLITPRRTRVLAAKLIAFTLIGSVIAVTAVLVTTGVAMPLLTVTGGPVIVPGIAPILAGSVLSTTLYTTLGVGVGALVRSQVAGVVVAVVWFLYAEYLLVWLVPDVGRWLPGGAAKAVSGWNLDGGGLLPVWAGGLLFVGYTLLVAVAANAVTAHRDVA